MKKIKISDCAVIGFALFGMFFGAGNLIFPPYLGLECQQNWFTGFVCFLIMDVGLAAVSILSISKNGDDARPLTNRLGKKISLVILIGNILCLGPFIAVPRTAATSFEFAIKPLIHDGAPWISWVYAVIFFAVAVMLSMKQSQIITIIGAVLAPTMFVSLIFLIFKGASMPPEAAYIATESAFAVSEGITAGYQTMDVMAGIIFASSIILGTTGRGYTDEKQRFKAIAISSVITISALGIVYGGLTYLGSKMTSFYGREVSRTELLSVIVTRILGSKGQIFLGILVLAACLTAAIGVLSSSSAFMTNISNGRISYHKILFLFAFIGFLFSNLGTEKIMKIALPFLTVICPILLTIVILGFWNKKIKSDRVFQYSCLTAFVVSLLSYIQTVTGINLLVNSIPLGKYGFAWVIPTVAVAIILSIKYNKPVKA